MKALRDTVRITFPLNDHIYAHVLINANIRFVVILLLLYVKFLRHSPWFYAESEYLGANRSGGSPMRSMGESMCVCDNTTSCYQLKGCSQ